eukprot:m.108171 g.108171  ORF g.108171 m.108171 type:complete len:102 (-) comp15208_c2_seq3:129-434(-)
MPDLTPGQRLHLSKIFICQRHGNYPSNNIINPDSPSYRPSFPVVVVAATFSPPLVFISPCRDRAIQPACFNLIDLTSAWWCCISHAAIASRADSSIFVPIA